MSAIVLFPGYLWFWRVLLYYQLSSESRSRALDHFPSNFFSPNLPPFSKCSSASSGANSSV